ncbi:MAG: M20/M25/M40 family metallo-hydrolase, partial [Atribacterota bacterium]
MSQKMIHQVIEDNRKRYQDEFIELLQIPGISAHPDHRQDIYRSAQWLHNHCNRIGLQSQIIETEGYPVLYAWTETLPGRPTILIYGHYDVQPVDPAEEWKTPSFTPTMQNGFIFARGADDDKGQFFTALNAMDAIHTVQGSFPLNVKIILEGEEEIGSPHFLGFLTHHQDELATDAIIILDGVQYARGIPTLTYGLRGLCYLQIDVQGPSFDVHSGVYGGVVGNPAQVLVRILSQLKNEDGQVVIPGFYNEVKLPEAWERKELAELPFDENEYKHSLGLSELVLEKGYTPNECATLRPTLDICGIWGGYSGHGSKTIIPSRAGAKVSMRLVPDQKPHPIARRFTEYIQSISPSGVTVSVRELSGIDPLITSKDQPLFLIFSQSIARHFGRQPV